MEPCGPYRRATPGPPRSLSGLRPESFQLLGHLSCHRFTSMLKFKYHQNHARYQGQTCIVSNKRGLDSTEVEVPCSPKGLKSAETGWFANARTAPDPNWIIKLFEECPALGSRPRSLSDLHATPAFADPDMNCFRRLFGDFRLWPRLSTRSASVPHRQVF